MTYKDLYEMYHPLRVRIYTHDLEIVGDYMPYEPILQLTTWKYYSYNPNYFTLCLWEG